MQSTPAIDLWLYAVHGAFWMPFGLVLAISGVFDRRAAKVHDRTITPTATPATAPYSRLLVGFHAVAFGLMYLGMGRTIFGHGVPAWFSGQRLVGALVIATGSVLMAWARLFFRSWRIRAKIEAGHELATGGPFRFLRNPIYMGLNLLALGSAIWVPTWLTWIAAALMALGSDLRGRAEEKLLAASFGDAFREYAARTRRFVPWIY
jgi:protein-S-isoprenylcysteine O-methyltransferase Ste14